MKLKKRYLVLAVAALLLIGGFVALKPESPARSNSQSSVAVKKFNLTVKNRELISNNGTLKVRQGDNIKLIITVDENEKFHLHGYDKSLALQKDQPAEVQFTADQTGNFEFELENSGTELGFLQVSPR